jgi:predicted NBD/HSP70 family sugar kinase
MTKAEQILAVLDSLHDDALRTLAAASSAPPTLAGILLQSLGPGTLRVLEMHGVIKPAAHRRGKGTHLTPFGQEVLSSAADMAKTGRAPIDVRAAQAQLDEAYADFLGVQTPVNRRPFAIGVDIGHYDVRVALGTREGELLAASHEHVFVDKERTSTLALASQMAKGLLESTQTSPTDIAGIGMGIPGPIDQRTGQIMVSSSALPYLRDWADVNLRIDQEARSLFEQELGYSIDVRVENDANLCALGEATYGAGAGLEHFVFVKLSAGIGAGLYLQGSLYRGADGVAGEFGHTPVVDYPDGSDTQSSGTAPVCDRCGRRGCLEAMASGITIVEDLECKIGERNSVSLTEVIDKAAEVPDFGLALNRAGRYIGVALSGLMFLLNPQAILIGGVLTRAGDQILSPIQQELADRVGRSAERVLFAEHRENAAVFGALEMAFASADTEDGIDEVGVTRAPPG